MFSLLGQSKNLLVASRRLTTQVARRNGTKLVVAGGVIGAGVLFSSTLAQSESSSPLINKFVAAAGDKVPLTGLPGTKYERTFIAIKPDGVQVSHLDSITARVLIVFH